MKHFRVLLTTLALVSGLAASRATAQVTVQRLNFSLLADHQIELIHATDVLTNERTAIQTALVTTGNVMRALRYEMFGTNWATNFPAAELVREVNLVTGAEGIFMREGTRQTNVSAYFGGSAANDFTGQVDAAVPALQNNFSPNTPLRNGHLFFRASATTSNLQNSETFFFISLNTTNLKFNVFGFGETEPMSVRGRFNGTLVSNTVDRFAAQGIGSLYYNSSTNLFPPPFDGIITNAGPTHGMFSTGVPVYLPLTDGP
ncbi:MAG TPA: hypothetical protein VHB20_13340 [Verrucomicrobiae bacterium]|nr:hypothetical protein [Verrucomicrobiae bacterium]